MQLTLFHAFTLHLDLNFLASDCQTTKKDVTVLHGLSWRFFQMETKQQHFQMELILH